MSNIGSKIVDSLAPRVGYAYLRLMRATMRLQFVRRETLASVRRDGPYILAFWHARFVMMPFCYPGERMMVLHSEHRDAQLLVGIMKRFGFHQAWGSSTRGGARGLRSLVRGLKDGFDVGITPDGPKGPPRQVHPGVLALARLSGRPIIPVAFSARPHRRLSSWDRTMLPYPFARGVFVYGEPQFVGRGSIEEEEVARLEASLDALNREADGIVGVATVDPPVDRP
ncbi:MAG: lysophospholipid acyltransferase family protein [Acidobacteriota bacterium]|nr:lysophospholipid acyltransferase family protein [Acidobacteriota bacterium]